MGWDGLSETKSQDLFILPSFLRDRLRRRLPRSIAGRTRLNQVDIEIHQLHEFIQPGIDILPGELF